MKDTLNYTDQDIQDDVDQNMVRQIMANLKPNE